MLKKIITTAVLGVSVLGVMTANAATGAYVTGQFGYANTHMANKTNLNDMNFASSNASNLNNNGAAARFAVGYQLNQNFAVELGSLAFSDGKADVTMDKAGDVQNAQLKLRQGALDLVGKGILPITNNINVYGKLGIAYLTTKMTAKTDADFNGKSVPATFDLDNITKHKWAPEAAVGVSYDITPNVSVDTSWTHIQPIGGKNRPGNIDFVAVGVGYNFG